MQLLSDGVDTSCNRRAYVMVSHVDCDPYHQAFKVWQLSWPCLHLPVICSLVLMLTASDMFPRLLRVLSPYRDWHYFDVSYAL